jgi:Zn finger protein HypA/HybF involved in hydrogenase expression
MHETGLVEELIRQSEKVSQENGGGRITRIEVGIGEEAGFSPEHFEEHFRLDSENTLAAGAELVIHMREGDALTLEAVEIEST